MSRTVTLYNMSCQKMLEIDWTHAIILLFRDKVSAFTEDEFIDIKTTSGNFKLPLHIILKKYVHIPYKENNECQYCSCIVNTENATIDHVLPRSRGGKHEWNNVVTCCLKCNRKKGNRTPNEANMPLNKTPKPLRFGS